MRDIAGKVFIILDWHEQLNGRTWVFTFDDFKEAIEAFINGNYDTTFVIISENNKEEYLELQEKIGALKNEADTDHLRNLYWNFIDHDPKFKMAMSILEVWNDIGLMDSKKQELIRKYESKIESFHEESFCDPKEIMDWFAKGIQPGTLADKIPGYELMSAWIEENY